MKPFFSSFITLLACLVVAGCSPGDQDEQESDSRIQFEVTGHILSTQVSELSGLEAVGGPRLIAHNDDGPPVLFIFGEDGKIEARLRLKGVKNRDWEELTLIDSGDAQFLVVGDIGDNLARHDSMRLHFVDLSALPDFKSLGSGVTEIEVAHSTHVYFPDGARDCEAMAYDPSSNTILFATKRDKPPRVYSADAGEAMNRAELELQFLGTMPKLRPPTRGDALVFGTNTQWISQPTGMDIDASGRLAAIITYRSLYLFERGENETWREAFFGTPREFLGPRSKDEEAIAFSPDMQSLYVSAEGIPAPIYKVSLPQPESETN